MTSILYANLLSEHRHFVLLFCIFPSSPSSPPFGHVQGYGSLEPLRWLTYSFVGDVVCRGATCHQGSVRLQRADTTCSVFTVLVDILSEKVLLVDALRTIYR